MKVSQDVPPSRLKVKVTGIEPGFGEITPDNVTLPPTVIEVGEAARVIVVEGLV
jgi:hypothetical protein